MLLCNLIDQLLDLVIVSRLACDLACHVIRWFVTLDSLVKRHNELERIAFMYTGMVQHTKTVLKAFLGLSHTHKGVYCSLSLLQLLMAIQNSSEMFWCPPDRTMKNTTKIFKNSCDEL